MSTRVVTAVALGLALGIAAGQSLALYRLGGRVDAMLEGRLQPEPAAATPAARLHPADLAALRSALVSVARAPAACATPAPNAEPVPGDPDSEQAELARAELDDLFGAARARGTWTDADVAVLHRQLPHLAPEDVERALSTLALALNEKKLRRETSGPPW